MPTKKKKSASKVSKLDNIAEGEGAKTGNKEEIEKSENEKTENDGATDGGGEEGKKKKKKRKKMKRKKRVNKDEKAKERIMKKVKEFMKNTSAYSNFMNKMDHWMLCNHRKVETFFGRLDDEDEGVIPVDIFKSGLHDLECPITELEFQLLVFHLDPIDRGVVNYRGFDRGFIGRHSNEGNDAEVGEGEMMRNRPDDYLPTMYTKGESQRMTSSDDPFHGRTPRFVQLEMRLATFNDFHQHPCHVTFTVHNSMQIRELCKLVSRMSHVSTGEMSIYTSSKCDADERLPRDATLAECGVRGANKRSPITTTLYYDYSIEFSDCSLLTCDHYFDRSHDRQPVTAYIQN